MFMMQNKGEPTKFEVKQFLQAWCKVSSPSLIHTQVHAGTISYGGE